MIKRQTVETATEQSFLWAFSRAKSTRSFPSEGSVLYSAPPLVRSAVIWTQSNASFTSAHSSEEVLNALERLESAQTKIRLHNHRLRLRRGHHGRPHHGGFAEAFGVHPRT